MKKGRVVSFNNKTGNGSLSSSEGGAEILFHIKDMKKPEMTYFRKGMIVIYRNTTKEECFEPKVGDLLNFEIDFKEKSISRVKRWVYNLDYQNILKNIDKLPMYRVVHKYYDKTQKEMWKGLWPFFCPKRFYDHEIDKTIQTGKGNWSLEKYWQTKLTGDDESCWERCNYPLDGYWIG